MKIHTVNTGAQYSEHGQRIAWVNLGVMLNCRSLVAFYDADRMVHNVVRVDGLVTQEAFLKAYLRCDYERSMWLSAELQEELRVAAVKHGLNSDHSEACPGCQGTNLRGGSVDIEGSRAYQTVVCQDCDTSWIDGYVHATQEVQ